MYKITPLLFILMIGGLGKATCGCEASNQPHPIPFTGSTNAPIPGGKSPDGKYEVRIVKTSEKGYADYCYAVVDASSGKMLYQIPDRFGSFCVYEGIVNNPGYSQVWWNHQSDLFVLMDHGSRHCEDLYFYKISPKEITKIETPDFLKKGLALVGFKQVYLVSVARGISWEGDMLKCSFAFDAETAQGRSDLYTTEFFVEIKNKNREKPTAIITKMNPPHGNPG